MRLFSSALCAAFFFSATCHADGLLGGMFKALGNATGFKPMVQLGQSLDDEHRRLKEHNPDYKKLEEGITQMANAPGKFACVQAFEAIVQPVKLTCNRFVAQTDGTEKQRLIEDAKQTLISGGIFPSNAFTGIHISWCQHSFEGSGITPNSEEIILNRNMQADHWKTVTTLAHEMKHIEQYRRMGTDNFKCDYAIKFSGCLCQDARHGLENEAYQFEASVLERLIDQSPPIRQGVAAFLEQRIPDIPQMSSAPGKPGTPPRPQTREEIWLRQGATNSCTVEGKIPRRMVTDCIEELSEVFIDIAQAIDDDPVRNMNQRFQKHVYDRAKEVNEVCKSVSLPAKLWGRSEKSNYGCNMVARSVLRKKAYNILPWT